jgi:hypothetical protein
MKPQPNLKIKPLDPEVFVVTSWECGLCNIFNNIQAAVIYRDEMNVLCPEDNYRIESWRIRSE